eukprot:CAMPEP_0197634230 /NCGR_PEP_ID=MMETSP1338-20131121/10380_1 /TAXON_ID=43686 ORGANISM="Pelagodinium beii, Strain RCC1491" /NCGR_SAMPLE_ID=MMETSP1338 /ASSEMBLY_ACC=CAM_ASM_000754 /LENGTH=706 /DNA_ID=CAMNT_0043206053 /DNA_START=56 /DNA_END=2176 /DNA_ORIENTATION=-
MKAVVFGLLAFCWPAAALRTGTDEESLSLPPEEGAFRVFASSWNAGNTLSTKYAPEAKKTLIDNLLSGHSESGREADLVILGFQEFLETGNNGWNLANSMESYVWKPLTDEKLSTMNAEMKKLSEAPTEVKHVQKVLADLMTAVQEGAGSAYEKFLKDFGLAGGEQYPDPLATKASADAAADWSRKALEEAEKLETASKAERDKVLAQNLAQVDEARAKLLSFEESLKSFSVNAKLEPIRAWTKSVVKEVRDARAAAEPSWTAAGEFRWSKFLDSIDNVAYVEKDLGTEIFLNAYKAEVKVQTEALKTWLRTEAEKTDGRLAADWLNTQAMLARLQKDYNLSTLEKTNFDGWTKVQPEKARKHLKDWMVDTSKATSELLSPTALGLRSKYLAMQSFWAKFDSGTRCHLGRHYDTMIVAYSNPWSPWKISHVPYSSSKCKDNYASQGCSLDNNVGMECGKVVNLMVLQAKREQTEIRICALNTHMSFEGEASARLQYISEALLETQSAGCNMVVFVGDFNTRLHCFESGSNASAPLYDGTVDSVLDHFCNGNQHYCPLTDSSLDEMNQFMTKDEIKCFEKETVKEKRGPFASKEKVWKVKPLQNTLDRARLREASIVHFNPTYKLMAPHDNEFKEVEGYTRCLQGESMCFVNREKKYKRNPAWTDRILIKDAPGFEISTDQYNRKLNPNIESDHGIVSASMIVRVQN